MLTKLRRLRLDRHLSQVTLGERAGLPQHYVSQLENGIRPRRFADLDALAAALGVPPTALFEAAPEADTAPPLLEARSRR